jgi:hypothetical protein
VAMNTRLFCVCILLAVFIGSCVNSAKNKVTIRMDKERFLMERAAWNDQNVKNYQFTYYYYGESVPKMEPLRVTVRENEESVIENPYDRSSNLYIYTHDISEVYDKVFRTIGDIETLKIETFRGYKLQSLTLDITYNLQYHYPKNVVFTRGYVNTKGLMGGVSHKLEIIEFTPLD